MKTIVIIGITEHKSGSSMLEKTLQVKKIRKIKKEKMDDVPSHLSVFLPMPPLVIPSTPVTRTV